MPHHNHLESSRTALVVVDIQEAFRSAIPEFALIASRAAMAVRGFRLLNIPIIVTEQYPKGLGHTAEEIQLVLEDGFEAFEKSTFSSCGSELFVKQLVDSGFDQIVLCGLEAHICVSQTVHDLLDRGLQVHILLDCISSRFEIDKVSAIAKMQASGAISSSIELALFELVRDAKHDKFKEIQALIK